MKLGLGNFRTAFNTPEAQLVEEGWSNLEPAALPQSLSPSSHPSSSLSAATLCLRRDESQSLQPLPLPPPLLEQVLISCRILMS